MIAESSTAPSDCWHEGSRQRGRCPTLRKRPEQFVVHAHFNAIIVMKQNLLDGPQAKGCFLVGEPLGSLVQLVGRNGEEGSVALKELSAKQRLQAKGVVHSPNHLSRWHVPPGLVPVDDAADLASSEKEVGVLVVAMNDLRRGSRSG